MQRLLGIADDADILIITDPYVSVRLSTVDGAPVTHDEVTRPAAEPSTVEDFSSGSTDDQLTDADLGSRDGFDTLTAEVDIDISEVGTTFDPGTLLDGFGYGFWGEYGLAELRIASGPISGEVDGSTFSGDTTFASVYVLGNATGTNPAGTGAATWTGIAEATTTDTFVRRSGTAEITIADLSQPRVSVAIDIDGSRIGPSAWSDLALTGGGFSHGTQGTDLLEGNFHGPDHDETYGIFDTDSYLGAFGAKRVP